MEQTLLKSFQKDKLTMRAYVNRTEMGKAAAADATLASVAKSLGWDNSTWNFASNGSGLGFTIKQLGDNKIEF